MTAPAHTSTESPVDVLVRALNFLSGRCDGARTEDGVGFNKYDAQWADVARDRIDRGQGFANVDSAHRILTKYRKQLATGGIELPQIEAVHQHVAAAPAPRVVGAIGGPKIELGGAGRVKVSFPYDPELVAKIKTVPGRMFDGASKSWWVPNEQLDAVLALFPSATLAGDLARSAQESRAKAEEAQRQAQIAAVALQNQIARDLREYERIKPTLGRVPFDHQDTGIRWLIEQRKVILADDMGLGKTFQALVASKAIGWHIIVLAPAGLRVNWFREAAAVDVRIEVHSWAKVPTPLAGKKYILIADEAHYAQNLKAQRTKNFLALAEHAQAAFLLTGTPIKNGRPSNLFPLLVAIKHQVAQNRSAYERRYCNAGPTRWSRWDVTGAAHLEELHGVIADSLIRRMKSDVLDLPEKTRVRRDAELSGDAKRAYDETLSQLRREYQARIAAGEISSEGDALVMLGHLRHAGSIGKVDTAIEIGEELIDSNQQVVIFTAFVESARAIAAKLGAGLITGEQNADQRQAFIDEFQVGALPAMVCTLGAGNVGITLTAAQTVILVDRPWTPGDAVQAEDRLHRIGQRNAVTAIWLQTGEVDRYLDDILEGKHERAETVLTGEAKTTLGIMRAPKTLKEVAAAVFGEEAKT